MPDLVKWRWDQGRFQYFRFDNIERMARTLDQLDGADLNAQPEPLWPALPNAVELPFLPHSDERSVWRNYARVFGSAFLATKTTDTGELAVTELCHRLANPGPDPLSVDEYMSLLLQRFYFPTPVFQGYDPDAERVFPYCAVLRYVLANADKAGVAELPLSDVFSKIVGNACSGKEPLSIYRSLPDSGYSPTDAEWRHVREMLIFFSQFSFLKWAGNTLYLDLDARTPTVMSQLEMLAEPAEKDQSADRPTEILKLGALAGSTDLGELLPSRELPMDAVFTEGKKVRVTHLRTERSQRLRRMFFEALPEPYLCNMCDKDIRARYPWTVNILEIHHLLPLGSPVSIQKKEGTSLSDLVAVCPNCHRAVHRFYKNWLTVSGRNDFEGHDQAKSLYEEAKSKVATEV